jgi:hypothetical protein
LSDLAVDTVVRPKEGRSSQAEPMTAAGPVFSALILFTYGQLRDQRTHLTLELPSLSFLTSIEIFLFLVWGLYPQTSHVK